MTGNKRKWLIRIASAVGLVLAALAGTAWYLSEKIEPYVRERTVAFLEERFDGEVTLGKFDVSMPIREPLKVLLSKGRGAMLRVRASEILLRQRGAREGHPLLTIGALTFELDLSKMFESPAVLDEVRIEGMKLALPPKGERRFARKAEQPSPNAPGASRPPNVLIDTIIADGTKLVILPKDTAKAPLEFDLYKLTLKTAGAGVAMKYTTTMRNAKPPGVIDCHGTFGPFETQEPGESPLTGDYVFKRADLAVFKGIAGLLDSTGRFSGKLNEIVVDGETTVPDFRLPAANNPMPLKTRFHAVVDGTNGNTRLDPVDAVLGTSPIRCQGGVVRLPGENGKTVDLDCTVRNGRLDQFLRLAVKGPGAPMKGFIDLDIKIVVPPEKVPYSQKLQLSGPFKLREAIFTNPRIQEQLDDMSRRAQGKPSDMSITGATSSFEGSMKLQRQLLTIPNLVFSMPGAMVRLSGNYDMRGETVDFHGQVRTEARLSQMMKTGWKRLALKPVDPFFAKDGAGAQFDVAITGPAGSPKFGLEKKKK
jgi:hypothetical protein